MARKQKSVPLTKLLPSMVANIRRYRPQLVAQKGLIVLSLGSLLLAIAARVFEPWPLKFIFDMILIPGKHDATTTFFASHAGQVGMDNPRALLLIIVTALVVLVSVRASMTYFSQVAMAVASTRIVTEIRAKLFSHLQKLSLAYHYKAKSGDLITRFTYDVNRLREVTSMALIPLLANLLTVVSMVVIMFWLNAELSLFILAVIPLFFLSSLRFSTKIKNVVRTQREQDGAVAAAAAESIGAIKIVQALSLSGITEKAFSKHNKKSLKQGAKAQRLGASLERNVEILLAVATAVILWRGVHLVLNGAITTGTLLVFTSYLALTFRPMRQSAKYLTQISKALASADRVGEILETLPDIIERPDAIEAQDIHGAVCFENVSFHYHKQKPALTNFTLTLSPGERVALVGPSGAGKSTVLSLLLRLYDPQKGQILLDDRDLKDFSLDSLRKQMSIVLQDSVLFAVSIRDNIAYGRLDATEEEIYSAARLANAHQFITELPNGYDTVVGERGADLSGGQRQRIALARAVVRNAPIMILDEPTTGLDKTNEREVLAALQQCTRGITTIMVSHDLHAARSFDRICYIADGCIAESGTHKQLYDAKGAYWALYTQQTEHSKPYQGPVNQESGSLSALN
jgi:ATP-binding cassette subfamily B protein